jgi:4'-phosphopantetheinyl transferase EntD
LNPTTQAIAAAWEPLLPPQTLCATRQATPTLEGLSPSEQALIQGWNPNRQAEYTTSRSMVYEMGCQLGKPMPRLIPKDPDGAPEWPAGLCGSITHCKGICSVVMTTDPSITSIGIDLEKLGRLKANAWKRIASPFEAQCLQTLSQQTGTALEDCFSLLFSAKEAYFKCHFPLHRSWLGFEDVTLLEMPLPGGCLMATHAGQAGEVTTIRWAFCEHHVLCCAIPARTGRSG